MEKLKIYLADDHQILIDGLTSFFESTDDISVVGTANNGDALLRDVHTVRPDIILLDLNMPRMDGMATLKELRKQYPQLKVIVLSSYHQSYFIDEARKNGAKGYLLKNGSKSELLNAIRAVQSNQTYFPEVNSAIEEQKNTPYTDDFKTKFQLTKREIEIIRLISEGLNSLEISNKLFIAENTVNTHRRNIQSKLQVKNVASMLFFARKNGIC